MEDNKGEQDNKEASTISSDREQPDSLLNGRSSLLSTIKVRIQKREKKARKLRFKTTQTQCYFDVIVIDETQVNKGKQGKPKLINRQQTCKICGLTFLLTNKERHRNTSKLNNHLCDAHDMNKQKH